VTGGWPAYAGALADLHAARAGLAAGRQGAARGRAERAARLAALDAALQAQQAELRALAADLRAPLTDADLQPLPGPPLPSPSLPGPSLPGPPLPGDATGAAEADAQARLESAAAALAEARRVARLPQLLPEWSGDLGRAAVVYLGFAVPNVLLVVALSVTGVHGSSAALLWFVVIWPLVTAVGGAVTVSRTAAPRLPPDEPAALLTRLRPPRRYPWLGVLVAWASWLGPGWLLDQVAALTTG
jgi:hypothetical protein